jgi:hypothetical protein
MNMGPGWVFEGDPPFWRHVDEPEVGDKYWEEPCAACGLTRRECRGQFEGPEEKEEVV